MSRGGAPSRSANPPAIAALRDGTEVDLPPVAREICRRHLEDHPEEVERYGENGRKWCEHDNRWILAWAIRADAGHLDLTKEISWLARVLEAREFPLEWLAGDLDLAGEELLRASDAAAAAARLLHEQAARVRATPTFLD